MSITKKKIREVLANVPQFPRRIDRGSEQLEDLIDIAEKFGLSGAADFIRDNISTTEKQAAINKLYR